jgi:hypothetical protein
LQDDGNPSKKSGRNGCVKYDKFTGDITALLKSWLKDLKLEAELVKCKVHLVE